MVDYHFELSEPERTIRRYEWAGIVDVVRHLVTLDTRTRWLDFGCGGGGLPRYAKAQVGCEAMGFEEGAIALKARKHGIAILERAELDALEGSFDVVTAIEVMEHVVDPLATLTQIRRLLRPGGVLFYTTGNARPFRERLTSWSYFTPEIHISLYEPSSMERALRLTGFDTTYPGFIPGWEQIMAFKVLKNLGVRRASAAHHAIPWRALTPALNWRFGLYDFPVATAV
jgi:SAM-dependent methyltransferase